MTHYKNIGKYSDYILLLFLFLSPFLDVVTSLNIRYELFSFPLINVIKILLLGYLYLLLFFKKQRKEFFRITMYLFLLIAFGCLYLYHLKGLEGIYLLKNAEELIRVFYYPVGLVLLYFVYKNQRFPINGRILTNLFCVYLVFLAIPNILGIGFNGYTQGKSGNIGWFYSSNEISAILSILLPFVFYEIHKLRYAIIKPVLIIGIGIVLLNLGSKAPIGSFLITFTVYCFYLFQKYYRDLKQKLLIPCILGVFVVGSFCFVAVPKTQLYKNTILHLNFLEIHKVSDMFTYKAIDRFVMSDRFSFLEADYIRYKDSSVLAKAVGLGFYQQEEVSVVERKSVEIDYVTIFFNFGFLGAIIFVLPILFIFYITYYLRRGLYSSRIKSKICFASLTLAYILAFFTGHVLISPSVSFVVMVLHMVYYAEKKGEVYEESIVNY